MYHTVLKPAGVQEEGDSAPADHTTLRHRATDVLFHWLGIFTHCYGITLTVLFFIHAGSQYPVAVKLLESLSEPYLGALGIYVILKEIRKRYQKVESMHYGELFVGLWVLLGLIATITTAASDNYNFDTVLKLIITNSLATLVIYIGGVIHNS